MRIKNLNIYPRTVGERDRLAEEYESLGFQVEKSEGKLTVLALPRRSKNQKVKKTFRPRRDK